MFIDSKSMNSDSDNIPEELSEESNISSFSSTISSSITESLLLMLDSDSSLNNSSIATI
uniref:Uncharacterized protein n=1 Tax=Cryptosporidium parvum TaxID=5807 RepID=F0X527_CRYPV